MVFGIRKWKECFFFYAELAIFTCCCAYCLNETEQLIMIKLNEETSFFLLFYLELTD